MAGSEWEEPIVLRAPYTRSAILRPMTQTNIEIVRRSIEAFNRGDRTGTLADYAPGAEWHTTGVFADDGVYHGHAGLEQLTAELGEDVEALSFSISEIRAAAGAEVFVAMTMRGRGKRSKASFQQPSWYVVTLHDRQIVRVKAYLEPTQALEAAGLPA